MAQYNWTYKATGEKETGYEDMPSKFFLSPDDFNALTEEKQNELVTELIAWIRTKNHFPVYYFNDTGVKNEILKVVKKNDIKVENGQLVTQSPLGLLLLDYMFPNLHYVDAGYYDNNSMVDRFNNDETLAKCLKGYMKRYSLKSMRTAFFQLGRMLWATATNYSPMRARAIFEYGLPHSGVVYDYSCGFGGRMLGCLSSKNNYTYIGCEPNSDTFEHLNELGAAIDAATGRKHNYKIYQACSEDLKLEENSIDFAFSCPPFFALERYSTEETQCYNRFKTYKEWLESYVRPTIRNIYAALKPGCKMATDILDFNWRNTEYHLVADWKRIAAEEGFTLVESIPVMSRSNARKNGKTNPDKLEQVYFFQK